MAALARFAFVSTGVPEDKAAQCAGFLENEKECLGQSSCHCECAEGGLENYFRGLSRIVQTWHCPSGREVPHLHHQRRGRGLLMVNVTGCAGLVSVLSFEESPEGPPFPLDLVLGPES